MIPNVKTATLRDVVISNVEPGTTVSTDEPYSYGLLTGDGYRRGAVKHGAKKDIDGVKHQHLFLGRILAVKRIEYNDTTVGCQ